MKVIFDHLLKNAKNFRKNFNICIQVVQYLFGKESAVHPYQPDGLALQVLQRVFEERKVVGRRGCVARPQPVVGNHPDVRHKGQYRVVGVAAGAFWIVALCRTLLLPLAHHHRGVEV